MKKHVMRYVLFAVLVVSSICSFANAEVWNASDDFWMGTQPVGNAWDYGWMREVAPGSGFQPFVDSATLGDFERWYGGQESFWGSQVYNNPTDDTLHTEFWSTERNPNMFALANTLILAVADTDDSTVARWTAPADGEYEITADFWTVDYDKMPGDNSYNAYSGVFKNGSEYQWHSHFATFNDTGANHDSGISTYSDTLTLVAGDTIEFRANRNHSDIDRRNNSLALDATIELVPEPATMAIFGLGSLMMLRRKKSA